MKRSYRILSILPLLTLIAPPALHALDLEFSATLEEKAAFALPNYADNDWEDWDGNLLQGDTSAEFKLDASQGNHSAFLDCALLFDALGAGSSGLALDNKQDEKNFFFKFKEGWYDYNGGFWSLRVGRQITAWGAADGLQVADILCPKDMTRLMASDYSDSRMGIDAVRLSYNGTILSADAYWIPIFKPSCLPLEKKNPLRQLLVPSYVKTELAGSTVVVGIQDFTEDDISKPETNLRNGEYAARLSAYTPFADFSLYGFWGWDDEPVTSYYLEKTNRYGQPVEISLTGEYKRMGMVGADTSIPIGPLVARAEAAFFPGRFFSTNAAGQLIAGKDAYVQMSEITFLAGLDLVAGSWTVTGQYYGDAVMDKKDYVDREDYSHQATLSISKTFMGGNLELGLAGMVEFNDLSFVIQPSISYAATDQLSFKLGANFFRPGPDEDEPGTYGRYEDLSCVTLGAKFSF
ncbi:MAG: hypothetical protein K6G18_05850 [Treponema sp.]|nr:hypothetical protein [Treponema sp.]